MLRSSSFFRSSLFFRFYLRHHKSTLHDKTHYTCSQTRGCSVVVTSTEVESQQFAAHIWPIRCLEDGPKALFNPPQNSGVGKYPILIWSVTQQIWAGLEDSWPKVGDIQSATEVSKTNSFVLMFNDPKLIMNNEHCKFCIFMGIWVFFKKDLTIQLFLSNSTPTCRPNSTLFGWSRSWQEELDPPPRF